MSTRIGDIWEVCLRISKDKINKMTYAFEGSRFYFCHCFFGLHSLSVFLGVLHWRSGPVLLGGQWCFG